MATLAELKNIISGLNPAQRARFNQTCTSKVYDASTQSLTSAEQTVADMAANEINSLNTGDFNTLAAMTDPPEELSARPC